jgi:hypothetical protein
MTGEDNDKTVIQNGSNQGNLAAFVLLCATRALRPFAFSEIRLNA